MINPTCYPLQDQDNLTEPFLKGWKTGTSPESHDFSQLKREVGEMTCIALYSSVYLQIDCWWLIWV